jgi:hypothetical protein
LELVDKNNIGHFNRGLQAQGEPCKGCLGTHGSAFIASNSWFFDEFVGLLHHPMRLYQPYKMV